MYKYRIWMRMNLNRRKIQLLKRGIIKTLRKKIKIKIFKAS
jgi:hypothetical protein